MTKECVCEALDEFPKVILPTKEAVYIGKKMIRGVECDSWSFENSEVKQLFYFKEKTLMRRITILKEEIPSSRFIFFKVPKLNEVIEDFFKFLPIAPPKEKFIPPDYCKDTCITK